jgi:hypothetical protein
VFENLALGSLQWRSLSIADALVLRGTSTYPWRVIQYTTTRQECIAIIRNVASIGGIRMTSAPNKDEDQPSPWTKETSATFEKYGVGNLLGKNYPLADYTAVKHTANSSTLVKKLLPRV